MLLCLFCRSFLSFFVLLLCSSFSKLILLNKKKEKEKLLFRIDVQTGRLGIRGRHQKQNKTKPRKGNSLSSWLNGNRRFQKKKKGTVFIGCGDGNNLLHPC